ncbi:DUF3782 domain-containing protein [Gloeomargarita lithophora]|nr:DUF3782 domain-containing protein [Gloeomargarita lithophora]
MTPELRKAIQDALPELIANDPAIRDFVLRTVSNYYAGKEETESRFDGVLAELQRDREEQSRKWDEQSQRWHEQTQLWQEQSRKWDEQSQRWHEQTQLWQEQSRKWDEQSQRWHEQTQLWQEQSRKWDEQSQRWHEQTQLWQEQSRKWDEQNERFQALLSRFDQEREDNNHRWEEQHRFNCNLLEELKRQDRRYESTIGALGARWGLHSEASFRNALKGILEESFGVQVLNLTLYDEQGEVFGRPDQIELDLIIKNSLTIACEIKSSIDKAGMYSFDRKVNFYAQREQRAIGRKIVISPMVDSRAMPVAEALGIEIYSYAEAVEGLSSP